MMPNILCPYCQKPPELVEDREIYRRSYGKKLYLCRPCDAWVGCHEGTTEPLGRLANAELRKWKQEAHAWFDPMWKKKMDREGCSKKEARTGGYLWLAEKLGLRPINCHIGMFDVDMCRRVVEVCRRYYR